VAKARRQKLRKVHAQGIEECCFTQEGIRRTPTKGNPAHAAAHGKSKATGETFSCIYVYRHNKAWEKFQDGKAGRVYEGCGKKV
jgi:hypothetical protein